MSGYPRGTVAVLSSRDSRPNNIWLQKRRHDGVPATMALVLELASGIPHWEAMSMLDQLMAIYETAASSRNDSERSGLTRRARIPGSFRHWNETGKRAPHAVLHAPTKSSRKCSHSVASTFLLPRCAASISSSFASSPSPAPISKLTTWSRLRPRRHRHGDVRRDHLLCAAAAGGGAVSMGR